AFSLRSSDGYTVPLQSAQVGSWSPPNGGLSVELTTPCTWLRLGKSFSTMPGIAFASSALASGLFWLDLLILTTAYPMTRPAKTTTPTVSAIRPHGFGRPVVIGGGGLRPDRPPPLAARGDGVLLPGVVFFFGGIRALSL